MSLVRRRRRRDLLDRVRCNMIARPYASTVVPEGNAPDSCIAASESLLLIGDMLGTLRIVDVCDFETRLAAKVGDQALLCAVETLAGRVMTCTQSSIVKMWSLQDLASECAIDVFSTVCDAALSPFGGGGATDAAVVDRTHHLSLLDTRSASMCERVRVDGATTLTAVRWVDERCLLVAALDGTLSIFDSRLLAREMVHADVEPEPEPMVSYAWGSSWSAQLAPPRESQARWAAAEPLLSWAVCGPTNTQRSFDTVLRRYKRAFAPHPVAERTIATSVAVNADGSLVATTHPFDVAVKLWALNATGRTVGAGVASCNGQRLAVSEFFAPHFRLTIVIWWASCGDGSLALWRADIVRRGAARAARPKSTLSVRVRSIVFCGAADNCDFDRRGGVHVHAGASN
jgi:hypothetical protein